MENVKLFVAKKMPAGARSLARIPSAWRELGRVPFGVRFPAEWLGETEFSRVALARAERSVWDAGAARCRGGIMRAFCRARQGRRCLRGWRWGEAKIRGAP